MPGRVVRAVLFDLDGVLVESREATERVWMAWARKNGVGEEELRSAMHGVRSVEVVRTVRPELDAEAEAAGIEEAQAVDTEGLRAIPGAAAALSALREDRVAVVTSATRRLAAARLAAAGIAPPAVMVTAEEVTRGKPDPEGYLAAADRLGVDPAEALVVEDAPPGIEAGRAAGAATVAVTSTHGADELLHADVVIGTLRELPGVLARDFDASGVLRANDGH
ncbi:MAG TPA: HAD-IA family hydrolase [Thermoleophilaceae bacterium]|nr:HAD-IA family hydrolase [Thermoleophilaceae bacterium]